MTNKIRQDLLRNCIYQHFIFAINYTCFTCFLLLEIPLFNTVEI